MQKFLHKSSLFNAETRKKSKICLEIIVFQKMRKVFKENNPRSELKVLANIAKIPMQPFLLLLLLVYIEIKNIQTMDMSSFLI